MPICPKHQLNTDIVFFGIQGSGKTAQAEILAKKADAILFKFGEKIRQRIKKQDEFGKQLEQISSQGKYLNGRQIKIIVDEFLSKHSLKQRFIYDMPVRNLSQKKVFDQIMQKQNRSFIIIFLHLHENLARKRLKNQTNRNDASEKAIDMRIKLFHKNTMPVINQYCLDKIPILEIDASGNIQDVADKIETALNAYINF
ncbi:MAG: nucleoside monophosphate kinase [Patescibacteria group bacterium]|nr:nucleoside monophosphate kinase [Patescibacteria group bacterium]